jgi:hypothetical protein
MQADLGIGAGRPLRQGLSVIHPSATGSAFNPQVEILSDPFSSVRNGITRNHFHPFALSLNCTPIACLVLSHSCVRQ